jgi:hypothetical protein
MHRIEAESGQLKMPVKGLLPSGESRSRAFPPPQEMADFDTFERVLRVEFKRRKDEGQSA